MFMPNDVYAWDEKRIRILWSNQQTIFWIDIDDDRALPQIASKSDFEHFMARKELLSIADPYIKFSMTSPKTGSKAEAVQEKAWDAIGLVIKAEPDIYQRKTRGELFRCFSS